MAADRLLPHNRYLVLQLPSARRTGGTKPSSHPFVLSRTATCRTPSVIARDYVLSRSLASTRAYIERINKNTPKCQSRHSVPAQTAPRRVFALFATCAGEIRRMLNCGPMEEIVGSRRNLLETTIIISIESATRTKNHCAGKSKHMFH